MLNHRAKAYLLKVETQHGLRQNFLSVTSGSTIIPNEVPQEIFFETSMLYGLQQIPEHKVIIKGLADGHNVKTIAIQLGQSISSINKKLQRINALFRVKTNNELICNVLKRKIISKDLAHS